jgi:propanol-preferring alcohol dehydrogenase
MRRAPSCWPARGTTPDDLWRRPAPFDRLGRVRAWIVHRPGPLATRPLALVERDPPEPGPGEVRVRVHVCGVCRTDLHVAEGDLAVHKAGVVPGHEVVGTVDALGPGAARFAEG